ncbi:hypothetical protein SSX86_020966 [Deinandra increscens subsp. villosa]|uniref:NHL repeat-containing protein n=1 Tax=Deinandra increscens subsp. villosa TaxID=3103831 RepID=A0AAP0CU33_9ASTR
MAKILLVFSFSILLIVSVSSAAPPPILVFYLIHTFFLIFFAGIVNGVFSNVASALMKWASSLKATTKTASTGRPLMKFESGYSVDTVFDGSKLGIEPHSLEVLPNGELLVLDSANSNLYKISSSLSLYSRPKLVAGSADGYSGHVDGRLREAKMNHPKGVAVDDKGNIYVADTDNMAIRKISDTGVTTIAGGGKLGRGGHVDGPSEDARFSNDFDVVYIGSSCSLLVIDRGNQAIREIQLPFDDCAYQYGSGFPMGIAVLVAAGFFGYMLALLQRRVGGIISNQTTTMKPNIAPTPPYQKPSIRPPLIPSENEPEKPEEGFIASLQKLMANATSSFSEILSNVFPGFKRKQLNYHYENQPPFLQEHKFGSNSWPVQDSYVIPDGDEPPPSIETRTPTPKKTYPFMTNDAEKIQQFRQSRHLYSGWDQNYQQPPPPQQQQHHNRYYSSMPETYYEQSTEQTNEIVFGAVQEQAESMVIKPLDHGNSVYDHRGRIRSRSRGFARGD